MQELRLLRPDGCPLNLELPLREQALGASGVERKKGGKALKKAWEGSKRSKLGMSLERELFKIRPLLLGIFGPEPMNWRLLGDFRC